MSLITSENQIVCLPSFVLTVFWHFTSETILVVLWEMLMEPVIAPTRWCFWNVFLACEDWKNSWIFWDAYLSWPGAQIWFRHKWGKLVTASLLLDCIDWYRCPRYRNEFFFSCVSGFRMKFSLILMQTFAIGFQKWFGREGINFGFFWSKMSSFVNFISVWTEICKRRSTVILFWRHNFFRCLVWRVLWSVL